MRRSLVCSAITVLILAAPALAGGKKHPENYNTTITFSEFADGTQIDTQYQPFGIKFGGSGPFITDDEANPTSPVLSGTPMFTGEITGKFVDQGTGKEVLVKSFALDAGFFNNAKSTEVVWYDAMGHKMGSEKNTEANGIQRFVISEAGGGIGSWRVKGVGDDLNGFAIDNVSFDAPEIACRGGPKHLIDQYKHNKIDLRPLCGDPTKTAHSADYTFAELNVGGIKYALIRAPLVAPASGGFGVDAWAANLKKHHTITLGFLTPDANAAAGGSKENRHMFGDAADFQNKEGTAQQAKQIAAAATTAGADFVEQNSDKGDCQLQCVHADWRFHTGGFVQ
jgi:hypothetical protein